MKNVIYILLLVYALLQLFTLNFYGGTGDSGDSVAHYLFARWAPSHPELYFHHWAKPLFVLLASPFAQFGFYGIKIFNCIVVLTTIFVIYKIAESLNYRNPIIAVIITMFSPLYYILTFSGLTEPLFALFVAVGVWLSIKQRNLAACLIVSFLPYVRSEGLIILGVFAIYYLLKRNWKLLPFLLFGSLVYSIAGFFIHSDFLWVFTQIPYAKMSSVYGSGTLTHFAEQLINIGGVPIYILFWLGIIVTCVRSFQGKTNIEERVLILLGFCSFFIAHTMFWYLGIFNSMGLKRVLLGVIPLIAIIALQGYNFVSEDLLHAKERLKKIIQVLIVLYIILFPFTPNPAAIQWKKDMELSKSQQLAIKTANFILHQDKKSSPLLYNHHYLSVAFNLDHFDEKQKKNISLSEVNQMKKGDLLIWDNRYAQVETDIKKEELDNRNDLTLIKTISGMDYEREIIFSIYEKK